MMTTSTLLGYAAGFVGAALMLASYLMKSMVPLRTTALVAGIVLAGYAIWAQSWPTIALYLALIPINVKKLREIRKLVRAIETARADSPVAEWLLPHMTRRQARAGETLWRLGDKADEMVYVHEGQLRLVERDQRLGAGSIVGEIGLLSPDHSRTGTIRCDTDCTLYTLSAEGMAQLYYLEPKLGFHVLRLVVARLQNDARLVQERAAAGAAS